MTPYGVTSPHIWATFHVHLSKSFYIFSCDQAALWVFMSVRLSICLSICPSGCLSYLFHCASSVIALLWDFQELLPLKKSDVHSKGQGQRSRSQRAKQFFPQCGRFWTVTPVWMNRWLRNYAQSLKWCRRGAIFFQGHLSNFKVTRAEKSTILIRIAHFRTVTPDSYQMMHKAYSGIEEGPYCVSRSSVKFQGHTGLFVACTFHVGNGGINWDAGFIMV